MSECQSPNKVKHASAAAAKLAIRSLYRAGKGNPDYRAYRCGDHWHVGHSREQLRRRVQAALRGGHRD